MMVPSLLRPLTRRFTAVLALAGLVIAAPAPASAQGQTPPINFDGTNTTFFITAAVAPPQLRSLPRKGPTDSATSVTNAATAPIKVTQCEKAIR